MTEKIIKKVLIALLIIYSIIAIADIAKRKDFYQWDFRLYYHAALAYVNGENPYSEEISKIAKTPLNFKFNYLPFSLVLFLPFSIPDYSTAFDVFLVLQCAFIILLIYIWRKYFIRDEKSILFYFFCLLSFNSAIYLAVRAGNIHIFEQLLIWLGFLLFIKKRYVWFCVFIIAASLFKIQPVFFLLLLLFSEEKKRYSYFFISGALFFLFFSANYFIAPAMFAEFIKNVGWTFTDLAEPGLISPSTFGIIKDSIMIFNEKTNLAVPQISILFIYFFIIALFIYLNLRFYTILKKNALKEDSRILIFIFCLIYIIILPRTKDYYYILLILPAYYIIMRAAFTKLNILLFILCSLSSGYVTLPFLNIISKIFWGYYQLILAYFIWFLYIFELMRRQDICAAKELKTNSPHK